jgi:recombination protein RecA
MSKWRSEITKEFGDQVFQSRYQGEVVSTGSFVLDYLTEIRGFPIGRLAEVFGEEGSGKTTTILSCILQCLKEDRPVLFEDFEARLTDSVLVKMEIDPKKIADYRVMPESMEDGWKIVQRFCERPEHKGGMIFVDSLAAMPTRVELKEGIDGKERVGYIARVMAKSLRQTTQKLARANVGLVFVNQERASIDLRMGGGKTTPGGKALRFYSSLRVHTSLKGRITRDVVNDLSGKKEKMVTGVEVGLNIVKNSFGGSYRRGTMVIRMNGGIDNIYSALKVGEVAGICKQRGAYYILPEDYARKDDLGEVKKLGYEQMRKFLTSNPEIWNKYMKDVNQFLNKN